MHGYESTNSIKKFSYVYEELKSDNEEDSNGSEGSSKSAEKQQADDILRLTICLLQLYTYFTLLK